MDVTIHTHELEVIPSILRDDRILNHSTLISIFRVLDDHQNVDSMHGVGRKIGVLGLVEATSIVPDRAPKCCSTSLLDP